MFLDCVTERLSSQVVHKLKTSIHKTQKTETEIQYPKTQKYDYSKH